MIKYVAIEANRNDRGWMHRGSCEELTISRVKRTPGRMKPADIVLVVLFVAAAAVSLFLVSRANAGEKGTLAIIEVNGKEVKRIAIGEGQPARKFVVRGVDGTSTVVVKDGRIRMVQSHCRDKICVGVGWLDSRGKEIICLPNRVVVRVTGKRGGNGKVDTVTE
ncbi:MAG: NusG domain II-containing protein [Candidatus Geothermincolia bacterium]